MPRVRIQLDNATNFFVVQTSGAATSCSKSDIVLHQLLNTLWLNLDEIHSNFSLSYNVGIYQNINHANFLSLRINRQ